MSSLTYTCLACLIWAVILVGLVLILAFDPDFVATISRVWRQF